MERRKWGTRKLSSSVKRCRAELPDVRTVRNGELSATAWLLKYFCAASSLLRSEGMVCVFLKRAERNKLVAISQAGTVSKLTWDQPAAVISLLSSIEDIAVV